MRSPPRRGYVWLAMLLAVALALRLAAGTWWQARLPAGRQFTFGDSDTYWTLGRALARGEPFQYGSPDARIFRTPGYPLLLAALVRLAGDDPPVLWARGLSAVLGTLAVGGVYWLGRQLFNPATALWATALATIYPGAIGTGVFVLSEAPFCPLMLAHLAVWSASWQAADRRAVWLAALAGLLAGGATLMRPSWLAFTPFAVAAGLVWGGNRRKHLVLGLAMAAGLSLAMAPWWIRNARIAGRFVPTTLQVGASLYDGLNPVADGGSDMSFVPRIEAAERAAGDAAGDFEYRLDRRFRREALAWASANPGRALELAAIKFVRMWNIWPRQEEHRHWLMRLVMLVSYVPLLTLGVVGAWKTRRWGWPHVLCGLPAVYFSALHMVFASSIRYREPAMLPIVVLAAAALISFTSKTHWQDALESQRTD